MCLTRLCNSVNKQGLYRETDLTDALCSTYALNWLKFETLFKYTSEFKVLQEILYVPYRAL